MSPVKIVITDVIRPLSLECKHLNVYSAASMQAMEEVWDSLHSIDTLLKLGDKYQKGSLPFTEGFFSTIQWHYSFCIKKCGDANCNNIICKPTSRDFSQLPDSIWWSLQAILWRVWQVYKWSAPTLIGKVYWANFLSLPVSSMYATGDLGFSERGCLTVCAHEKFTWPHQFY